MSDESRKVARLIKFGLAIALGLVTEIVHVVRPSWARAGTIAFTKKLAGYLLIYDTKRIEDAAVVVPALTVALFSWAILSVPELWDLLKKTPSFLAQHIFAKFPSDLFEPIRTVHAWDPLWDMSLNPNKAPDRPLPWRRPQPFSQRYGPYKQLIDFASTGAYKGKHGPWKRPDEIKDQAFAWTVLVGPSGIGKTRLAVEFVLSKLGHCKSHKRMRRSRPIRYGLWRVKRWLRHLSPWHQHAKCAPWDIGWIKPEVHVANSRKGGGKFDREHASRKALIVSSELEEWRPRRPTVLLLDDPQGDDAGNVVTALTKQNGKFNFPVRLLIVNQTLPTDLGLKAQTGKDAEGSIYLSDWKSDNVCFHPIIVLDPTNAILSVNEIRIVLREMTWMQGYPVDHQQLEHDAVTIQRVTEGNSMLVEIAVHEVLDGKKIDALTSDGLVMARALRILDSLETLNADELQSIASATLAGPARIEDNYRIGDVLDKHQKTLMRCYNLSRDKLKIGGVLPAIRPVRVGDAFVELLLSTGQLLHCERQIWPDAWLMNPQGVISTIARRAAYEGELGKLLRQELPESPQSMTFDPWELAFAYIRSASLTPVGRITPALVADALISAQQAWSQPTSLESRGSGSLKQVAALFDVSRILYSINASAIGSAYFLLLSSIAHTSASSLPEAELAALAELTDLVVRTWCGSGTYDWLNSHNLGASALQALITAVNVLPITEELNLCRTRLYSALAFTKVSDRAACTQAAEQTMQAVAQNEGWQHGREICLAQTWAKRHVVHTPNEAFHQAHDKQRFALIEDNFRLAFNEVKTAAEQVILCSGAFIEERDFCLAQAQAWHFVARTCGAYYSSEAPNQAEKAAERVSELSGRFKNDRQFCLTEAQAWDGVMFAASKRSSTEQNRITTAMSRVVNALSNFLEEREFRLEMVRTLVSGLSQLLQQSPVGLAQIKTAAENVTSFAGLFKDEREFRFEQVKAWGHVAQACSFHLDWQQWDVCVENMTKCAGPFVTDNYFSGEIKKAQFVRIVTSQRGPALTGLPPSLLPIKP